MSTSIERPAWVARHAGRRWLWAVVGVVLTVVVATVMGQLAARDLDRARYGTLIGTSQQGEWADLGQYGLRARLDEVAVAESFPDHYAPENDVTAIPGLLLARVRMTVEPTVDIAEDNYSEFISCDLALWNGAGERINASGPMVAGPELSDCSLIRPVVAGQQYQVQVVFQIRPRDQEGLYVQMTSSDIRPQAGGSWPVWSFIPAA